MNGIRVDIWSDIACPWCYVGKRRLEAALAGFPHRDAVRVIWHAFELDPGAPPIKEPDIPYAERLAQKYGTSLEQAEGMIERMTNTAAAEGLDFHFELIRPGNTFDAHRLIRHAAGGRASEERAEKRIEQQVDALEERFFRAYLSEGEAIGDKQVLARLAVEAGLEAADVRRVLEGDLHAEEVRGDEEAAHRLGITGVPAFVIGERFALSGAQPAETLLDVLHRAWRELGDG